MKINIVSYSDASGGAGRAAYRLHRSLIKNNVTSQLLVSRKLSDDFSVIDSKSKWIRIVMIVKKQLSSLIQKAQKTRNPILHSANLFGTDLFQNIQQSSSDVVNLHWINGEALSIKQISQINKPIIMTLHDMWAFCGAEHYCSDTFSSRFRVGYKSNNKEDIISGLDINALTWKRKKKHWAKPFTIVTPSTWLSQCASESALFSGWDVQTIPNALDTQIFKPINKEFSRLLLNLPKDKKLIGFGAMGGGNDPRKGFDLLKQALIDLSINIQDEYECVVFGQSTPKNKPELGLPIKFIGHLNDDITLAPRLWLERRARCRATRPALFQRNRHRERGLCGLERVHRLARV